MDPFVYSILIQMSCSNELQWYQGSSTRRGYCRSDYWSIPMAWNESDASTVWVIRWSHHQAKFSSPTSISPLQNQPLKYSVKGKRHSRGIQREKDEFSRRYVKIYSVKRDFETSREVEEGLSAQLEEVNNKMGQVSSLLNYLLTLLIIGINFKVGDYAKVCQGAIKNGLKRR